MKEFLEESVNCSLAHFIFTHLRVSVLKSWIRIVVGWSTVHVHAIRKSTKKPHTMTHLPEGQATNL